MLRHCVNTTAFGAPLQKNILLWGWGGVKKDHMGILTERTQNCAGEILLKMPTENGKRQHRRTHAWSYVAPPHTKCVRQKNPSSSDKYSTATRAEIGWSNILCSFFPSTAHVMPIYYLNLNFGENLQNSWSEIKIKKCWRHFFVILS